MGNTRVIAYLLLSTILIATVVPAIGYAQMPGPMPPSGMFNITFNVIEAEQRIIVYSDGAIQPVYKLVAELRSRNELGIVNFYFNAVGEYDGNTDYSRFSYKVSGTFPPDAESGLFSFTLSAELNVDYKGGGEGVLDLVGFIIVENETEKYRVEFSISMEQAIDTVRVSGEIVVPQALMEGEGAPTGAPPSVDEINKQLASRGFGYIRVESIGFDVLPGERVRIRGEATIDLNKMVETAIANGLSEEKAQEVKSLFQNEYKVRGKTVVEATLKYSDGKLEGEGSLVSEQVGDLAEIEKLSAESTDALVALFAALLRPLTVERPELGLVISNLQVSAMAGAKAAVIRAPPSTMEAEVSIESIDSKTIKIVISYKAHRMGLAKPSGDPERDAEKLLVIYGEDYGSLVATISQIGFMVPGLNKAIPIEIVLEPASADVSIEPRKTSYTELGLVRVIVKKPATTSLPTETITSPSPSPSPSPTSPSPTSTPTTPLSPSPTLTKTSPSETTSSTPSTTPRAEGINWVVAAAVVVVVAAIVAAVLMLRRR